MKKSPYIFGIVLMAALFLFSGCTGSSSSAASSSAPSSSSTATTGFEILGTITQIDGNLLTVEVGTLPNNPSGDNTPPEQGGSQGPAPSGSMPGQNPSGAPQEDMPPPNSTNGAPPEMGSAPEGNSMPMQNNGNPPGDTMGAMALTPTGETLTITISDATAITLTTGETATADDISIGSIVQIVIEEKGANALSIAILSSNAPPASQ